MSDETKASATVSDYLRWRGDLTFAQDGFNEVDNLLLCIISYIKLENIPRLRSFDPQDAMPMGDVCRLLTEEDEQLGLSTLDYIPLMRQAAETPRFREVSLFAFESLHDEDRQMQFAAVSFLLPDGSVYAAYRGTDMTIVGWQEDFNMSFLSAVPAQVKAAEYAGADEEKKKIISEIFRRLAVDVKDELVKAAGAGVRRAGESILATGQAIADLRK